MIEGDRFSLGRVYRNLIKNAIQATAAGGRVIVTTARVGDHAEITVADTGSGIPPDRLSKIFDDFVTTKSRGLGSRAGDLEADRRAAGRHHHGAERGRTRDDRSRCDSRRETICRRRRQRVERFLARGLSDDAETDQDRIARGRESHLSGALLRGEYARAGSGGSAPKSCLDRAIESSSTAIRCSAWKPERPGWSRQRSTAGSWRASQPPEADAVPGGRRDPADRARRGRRTPEGASARSASLRRARYGARPAPGLTSWGVRRP